MSLIQKSSMTDKNREAHQRNGRQSRGAATPAGQERSRAAHLRHGFYSQHREEAIRALGEDPAELATLIEATHQDWRPTNAFQARLAERLARLLWRMERAERIQESLAARQLLQHEERRQKVALGLRGAASPQFDLLETLEESTADPRYYTPRGYFRDFFAAYGKNPHGSEKEILLLMHRLRKPQGGAHAPTPTPPSPAPQVGSSGVPPGLTPEESLAASPDSHRTEDGTHAPFLNKRECPEGRVVAARPEGGVVEAGPSAGGVAETQAPQEDFYLSDLADADDDDFPVPWPRTAVAEGAERDTLREELRNRVTQLLKCTREALEEALQEHAPPLSRLAQDELLSAPHRHTELMRREEEACFRQFVRLGNFLMKMQNHAAQQAENEGSSGYVDENTDGGQMDVTTNCPEPTAATTESTGQIVGNAGAEDGSPASEIPSATSEGRRAGPETLSPSSEVGSRGSAEVGETESGQEVLDPKSKARDGGAWEVGEAAA